MSHSFLMLLAGLAWPGLGRFDRHSRQRHAPWRGCWCGTEDLLLILEQLWQQLKLVEQHKKYTEGKNPASDCTCLHLRLNSRLSFCKNCIFIELHRGQMQKADKLSGTVSGPWFNTKTFVGLISESPSEDKILIWGVFFHIANNSFHVNVLDTNSTFIGTGCNYKWLLWSKKETTGSSHIPTVQQSPLCLRGIWNAE